MQKFIGIGNLTKDVELLKTPNGIDVSKFTIAIQRRFKTNGEYETDFINCVAFNNTAVIIEKFCKKGNKIAVVGTIQTRSYDTQDGTKKYVTEIVVDEVEFLNAKEKNEAPELKPINITDDLPF